MDYVSEFIIKVVLITKNRGCLKCKFETALL